VISLLDGSFHVIHSISAEPTWSPPPGSALSTENLSAVSRAVFLQVEHEEMQHSDVNRIGGMLSFDDSATVLWLHEFVAFTISPPSDGLIKFQRACRPADFSYKHDAQHNSVFVMAQLWDDSDDITALQSLVRILDSARMSTSETFLDFVRATQ
jgi:general transcription factor 3C polypeptide 4